MSEPVRELRVELIDGSVNVVGTPGDTARVEVGAVEGPPLTARHRGGSLSLRYDDLRWPGPLLRPPGAHRRSARITVSVPSATRVALRSERAEVFVSGIAGRTTVSGVAGGSTLVGLSGPAHVRTVSGGVEAQNLGGALHFGSVSGDLTLVEGGARVRAESVSGDMIIDVATVAAEAADIRLSTVSGEVAIQLPDPVDARVEASTTSGSLASAFEELRLRDGGWRAGPGPRPGRVVGTLGTGSGRLRATTVTGAMALLRRPGGPDPAAPRTSATPHPGKDL
ncbi:hypothetical protein E0L36_11735 [Streptomyces sp. AJS327]|nr:hypothetical protein [Streptomyces sp. AJS327]